MTLLGGKFLLRILPWHVINCGARARDTFCADLAVALYVSAELARLLEKAQEPAVQLEEQGEHATTGKAS